MSTRLVISQSPHAHGRDSVERNMYGVILALLPALAISFLYFGLGSFIVCSVSILACIFFEWFITKFMLRRPSTLMDGSAIVTGILLAFNLPSNFPVWMIVVGALVAIGIGKMTFGGLGNNPFNPALVGRCFLLVSFPAQMTSWPVVGQLSSYTDAVTGATPLSLMKEAIKQGDASLLERLPDAWHLLLGNNPMGGAGTIGEVCALALLFGMAMLLARRIITWHIPLSIIGTVYLMCGLLHLINPAYPAPLAEVLSGGLILGAAFMATDYTTSPMTHNGQLVFGIGIGVLTVVIRNWGAYPEGMSFAILIMNAFTPLINIYMRPKPFGEQLNTDKS